MEDLTWQEIETLFGEREIETDLTEDSETLL
jgi:hypothetical protein